MRTGTEPDTRLDPKSLAMHEACRSGHFLKWSCSAGGSLWLGAGKEEDEAMHAASEPWP